MNTRTFELNRLVRNRLVSDVTAEGGTAEHTILTGSDKSRAQLEKLVEETQEVRATGGRSLETLADLHEILEQVEEDSPFTAEQIETARQAKRERLGSFAGGWSVRSITVPADSLLAEHFAANPKRFPEVKNEDTNL